MLSLLSKKGEWTRPIVTLCNYNTKVLGWCIWVWSSIYCLITIGANGPCWSVSLHLLILRNWFKTRFWRVLGHSDFHKYFWILISLRSLHLLKWNSSALKNRWYLVDPKFRFSHLSSWWNWNWTFIRNILFDCTWVIFNKSE